MEKITRSPLEDRLERLEHIENYLEKKGSFETLKTASDRRSRALSRNVEWMKKPWWNRFLRNAIDLMFLDITFVDYNFIPFVTFFVLIGSVYANTNNTGLILGGLQLISFYGVLYKVKHLL